MRKRFLPALFLLSMITTCAEVDISVPGFPQIAEFFGVSASLVQATITWNFLGYCLGALVYGPLSDCFGRRRMMVLGNALMTLGAVGCYFAPDIHWLLLSRLIQGFGASTSVVLVFTMIADLYQGEKAMKLIGLMNAALSIVMSCAPLIGGFINEALGWKGNYGVVAIFSLLTWLLLLFFLPESRQEFDRLDTRKVMNDYRRLLTSPRFLTASMVPSLMFAAFMAYIAASAFLYMGAYELTTLKFVMHQAVIIASFAVTSMQVGKIIPYFGPLNTVRYGVLLSCASMAAFVLLSMAHISSPYLTTLWMSLFSVGFAACYPVLFSNSMSVYPDMQGPASSLVMSMRALLVTISTGAAGYFFNGQTVTVALTVATGVFVAAGFAFSWLQSNQPVQEPRLA
ncbi:multidrug effflux MFS transporter [Legionella geestiana]|uniref:multidrug effflux MFS transporter n=1 Tax=Legionella geestiana TaxID=45065 RepID=UPI001651B442|nr:multidrug effflux MFS transporter [Legionella geestiana]